MSGSQSPVPSDPDVGDLLEKLEHLEDTVDAEHERQKVRQTIDLVEQMPGSQAFTERIRKYTTRDIAESFVGGILLSLPLLVEDGVFEIAEWFAGIVVGPLPLFLGVNVIFIVLMTHGLLFYTDFRDVGARNPIFGVIPRRLVAVLTISFLVAAGMMFMWGRLHEEDPTTVEQFGRITVIWAASAFGAALGDILPGESQGEDIREHLEDIGGALGRDDD